ncbi:hypothetical protein ACFL6Y_09250 [Elusimicrobiota bacterium]
MHNTIVKTLWALIRIAPLLLLLNSCGTISTFQTGKTLEKGNFSFGMGMSGGLFRTKSQMVGYPIELGYAALEVSAGYGLFDFLDIHGKAMGSGTDLNGMPIIGGGSARLAIAQERWGSPVSIAVGAGRYSGRLRSRQTNMEGEESKIDKTKLRDRIVFVNLSKDIVSWFTLYICGKQLDRRTSNQRFEKGNLVIDEVFNDEMRGGGAGISINVGRDRNTHIMLEVNQVVDTDEPKIHYQKQAGLGMSVEF